MMRRTLTRLPWVRLMATRLMVRDQRAGRRVTGLLVGGGAMTVGCMTALLLGSHHLVWVAGAAVASMAAVVGLCLRWFYPPMAVSVIGVALACSSLMTALSVTTGFQQEIIRAVARVNGHVLLTKYGLDFFEYETVADQWRTWPEVRAASPFAYSMVAVVSESIEGGNADDDAIDESSDLPPHGPIVVIGKGVDPSRAVEIEGFASAFGHGDPLTSLRPGDVRHRPGIVLGAGLAARLGVKEGALVRVVVPAEINGSDGPIGPARHATFELMDLLSTGTSELDRNLALMHISAAQALFFRERRATGIEFELLDPAQSEEVAGEMMARLPRYYRLSTWQQTNEPLLVGLKQIRVVLSLVLGLMIVVSASSLIASLLLLIRRKRHDIAIAMAMGGSRSLVFWVFESVGLLAGVVGSVLGITLGGLNCLMIDSFRYPLGSDIYPVDHLPVVVAASDILGPAFAAIVVCGLASGPVAMMAARGTVLAALRR